VSAPIAIVGAGLAGLGAAHTLRTAGREVRLFDKGRSAGGRVASRRRERWQFDHGAQFATVRTAEFAAALAPLQRAGQVQRWLGPFRTLANGRFGGDPRPEAERWVGVPGMSALARGLAEGLSIATEVKIETLRREADGWWLGGVAAGGGAMVREGPFAAVLLTLPPPQAQALLAASGLGGPVAAAAGELAAALQPCLAGLVAFAEPVAGAEGGLFVADDVLSWIAHDGGKPGRGGAATYVLHATAAWSLANFDHQPAVNAAALVAAFARVSGRALPAVVHVEGHRWRYALASGDGVPGGAVVDRELGLALAGDSLVGGRVEGAFGSGVAAARVLLAH
jgi:hypothetical protein